MEPRIEKSSEKLNGVKCIVSNCYYHVGANGCSASAIEIAPQHADSSEETDCNTFTPHDDAL
ncbi:DUF1540 domain-containing protein [Clostridium oryzae]|uniref:DUF1540 domain-containing protein n=1 Tax=Clostridium oryzae TaxID=1450648 RepID=A0A1V4IZ23_9CLOT|nr:DUF1540 domain-containing protein [Clostridium oryzae]OPJ65025.1 hypothetical protein CLORY_00250 [Clostridium oryzae]